MDTNIENYDLYHSFLRKGEQRKKHKYIARIGESPKYRYFYTNAEYQAYLKMKNGMDRLRQTISNTSNYLQNTNFINSGQKAINSLLSRTKHLVNGTLKPSSTNQKVGTGAKVSNEGNALSKASLLKKTSKELQPVKGIKISDKTAKKVMDEIKRISSITIGNVNKLTKSLINKNINTKKLSALTNENTINSIEPNNKTNSEAFKKAKKIAEDWNNSIKSMLNQMNSAAPKSFSDLKKKTNNKLSPTEDMSRVNPYYKEDDGYTTNCTSCTLAYELRRRGYDVEAGRNSTGIGISTKDVYDWYSHKNSQLSTIDKIKYNAKKTHTKKEEIEYKYPGLKYFPTNEYTSKDVEKEILKQGEGARGQFIVEWSNGTGGHSVAYEVKNGSVYLRDCQNNKTQKVDDLYKYSSNVHFFRTDNEQINESALKNVRNKSTDTKNDGKAKTTPSALSNKYEAAGYDVYSFKDENGNYSYKVKLGDGDYLIIDGESGQISQSNG